MNAFEELGVKSPYLEQLKCDLSVAFYKAALRKKTQFANPKSFRLANDGPGMRSIDTIVGIIQSEGFEVEINVKVK